jgi:hypothetical protein
MTAMKWTHQLRPAAHFHAQYESRLLLGRMQHEADAIEVDERLVDVGRSAG